MNEKIEEKPFHESIVDAINGLSKVNGISERQDVFCLVDLIKHTKIPANHDAIISAWTNKMNILGYDDLGVPEIVNAKKPVDSKQAMDSAESLEKAIELAFDHVPLGKKYLGPKKDVFLMRNGVKKGHQDVAEVCVMSLERNDGEVFFIAYWDKDNNQYRLSSLGENKIEDWSGRW